MDAAPASPVLRTIVVSVGPGASALTLIPDRAYSAAIDRVKCSSAALAAPYNEPPGVCRKAAAEITLTTAAWSDSKRWGRQAWNRNSGPRTLTSNDLA